MATNSHRSLITSTDNTYNRVDRDQMNYKFIFPSRSTITGSPSSESPRLVPRPCPRFNDVITQFLEPQLGNTPSWCAVYGMDGVGKSQASYALAKMWYDLGRFTNIFYIQATSDEEVYHGFSRLLNLVSHPDRFAPERDARMTAARRWLENFDDGRWLLVIDSVALETVEFLRQHLPRENRHGSILFTTHTENVAGALTRVAGVQHGMVELCIPDVDDAARLLVNHIDDLQANADATKVLLPSRR